MLPSTLGDLHVKCAANPGSSELPGVFQRSFVAQSDIATGARPLAAGITLLRTAQSRVPQDECIIANHRGVVLL